MYISSEAWVLHSGQGKNTPGQLVKEIFTFPDISDEEVLAKPLYGCWEGNMDHAIKRSPVDLCVVRDEESVVLGNAGVVKIVRTGSAVQTIKEGDICLVFCNGIWDAHGYPEKILGYDAPGTMGVLAKTIKLHHKQVIPIPKNTPFTLQQWAAFSLRYITAYANWQVAYHCWRSQMPDVKAEDTIVCAWGGGVSLAEVTLAQRMGCQVIMIASSPERLALLERMGIQAIDRRSFERAKYEAQFLSVIDDLTQGKGVSIFIDNIGAPVYRTTAKALARQGVITTCGWKHGAIIPISRAMACISRHIYVHTHYARYSEGVEAISFAEEHDWMAPIANEKVYAWDDIPSLVEEYAEGSIATYFPIFSINEES